MNWAIFALRDIGAALDQAHYHVAAQHVEEAIKAILAQGEDDGGDGTKRAIYKNLSKSIN